MMTAYLLLLLAVPPAEAKPIETTISELAKVDKGNHALMDEQFADKRIRITATIYSIKRHTQISKGYVLLLYPTVDQRSGGAAFLPSEFPLEARQQLAKLSSGQTVVLIGMLTPDEGEPQTRFSLSMKLTHCKLIEAVPMENVENAKDNPMSRLGNAKQKIAEARQKLKNATEAKSRITAIVDFARDAQKKINDWKEKAKTATADERKLLEKKIKQAETKLKDLGKELQELRVEDMNTWDTNKDRINQAYENLKEFIKD